MLLLLVIDELELNYELIYLRLIEIYIILLLFELIDGILLVIYEVD